jgi:hypothetical protein
MKRSALGVTILTAGLAAQAALEAAVSTDRPALKKPLESIPFQLGAWAGRDDPVDPQILKESQADDVLNRIYHDSSRRGRSLVVWMNYSRHGLNLRHSPELCLPGSGYTKDESRTRLLEIPAGNGRVHKLTQLRYTKAGVAQGIGFWYYIFGEGSVEHMVRELPITSRSSHGRTTRGSGLTVEIFSPGDSDPGGEALEDFAKTLLPTLEAILPDNRQSYHIP